MSPERRLDPNQIVAALQRHPRIAYQKLVCTEDHLARLRDTLPTLHAFGGAKFQGVLPVVDWDHRLPSRTTTLRIYAYYSPATLRAGKAEFSARSQQINAQDRFPEFDVPDFAGLTADEAYEAELDNESGISKTRLVSAWRREIDPKIGRNAVQTARQSEQFQKLGTETRSARPDYLGDLEAVSWTPPCESGLQNWTIDVWYLMYLDAAVGKGRSFLVDVEANTVVGVREFVVRSG
ncbi:MAG: hypothetical protein JRH20_10025 [Deltaproteobacteria bacterium]|nr:hypothetical protein [Deltaproteobacteria bacterium]